jgi:hypothetical protein
MITATTGALHYYGGTIEMFLAAIEVHSSSIMTGERCR